MKQPGMQKRQTRQSQDHERRAAHHHTQPKPEPGDKSKLVHSKATANKTVTLKRKHGNKVAADRHPARSARIRVRKRIHQHNELNAA
jgi:hypothetical protein